jgi:hypothetical protein
MNTNQRYHEENSKKAIQNYYNTSLEAKIRNNNLLKYQVPRLIGKQRGIKLFGESKNCDYDGNVSGGSNITYSAALNSDEYEKYRKQTLQRRVDSLQAMKEEGAPPPMVELSQEEGTKLEGDSFLDAILVELSTDGLASNGLIYKYIKYLVNNIYFYDTNDFIKLLNIFDNFNDIIQHFLTSYKISNDKKEINQTIIDMETFNNIQNYIKENMKGENLDINKRKILAKSTIKYLKLNDMEKALKRNEEGRQTLQEIIDADDIEKAAERQTAAEEAAAIFTSPSLQVPPTPPPLTPQTPPRTPTRPPTKLQMYKMFIIEKAVEAGITDETHIKEIERLAVNYLKVNKRVLKENEIEALIQNYIDFMRQSPMMGDYDLNELD